MAISLSDDAVLLDAGIRMKFIRDADYSPAPPLVGLSGDEQTLLQCTPDGRLKVDTSVTIDNIDLGDVDTKAKDSFGVSQYLQVLTDPVTERHALITNDPRLTFTAGKLQVDASVSIPNIDIGDVDMRAKDASDPTIDPSLRASKNLAAVPFSVAPGTPDWALAVHVASVSSTAADIVWQAEITSVTAANGFSTWKEIYQGSISPSPTGVSTAFAVRGHIRKSVMVTNTDATKNVSIRILASVDDGATYDIPIMAPTTLAAGSSILSEDTSGRPFTHIMIQAQRLPPGNPNFGGDVVLVAKGYAF